MRRLWPSFAAVSSPLFGLLAVLGLFAVLFGLRGDLRRFGDLGNVQVLVHGDTYIAVAALGMLLVIISGGIDLSAGSVVALTTVVTMSVYQVLFARTASTTWASLGAVPAGVLAGGACGLGNGLLITRLRVSPFVVTLGMLSVARGLALGLAGRQMLTFPEGGRPPWVEAVARVGSPYTFFSPGFWVMLALALGVAVVLNLTVLGRHCYAIGSNEKSAWLCGVPVERDKVLIYTLAGLLTGVAGVLLFTRLQGDPNAANGMELQVIAAVVIGGASLSGGRGTVLGTLLGVLLLAVLKNGVERFNVAVELQLVLIGAIIVANTAFSQWQQRRGAGA